MSLTDTGPPRPIHGLDVRSLPLSPEDAFVLSRVDGSTPASEIAAATGLSEERVLQCLDHLRQLGAISFGAGTVPSLQGGTKDPSERSSASGSRPQSSARLKPVVEEDTGRASMIHPAARAYDPALLDEPAELDLERKKLILDLYYSLDQLTHYALLEVPEQATKEQIKEAYYQRVGLFHPDRYFGKELGTFKPRLEKVFGALTKAYDTLNRRRSREEYDRYLSARRHTAGLGESRPPARITPFPGPRLSAERAPAGAPPTTPQPPSAAPGATPQRPSVPPSEPTALRQALARKLRGSRPSIPPPPAPEEALPVDAAGAAEQASKELKARYAKHTEQNSGSPLAKYRKFAEEAIKARNYPSAVNALKVALSLAPDDPELTKLLQRTQEQADVALSDQFLEQARYEEKDGRLIKAAESYARAARGKKSALLYDRAAMCLIQAGTNARRAVELARKSVELDGERGTYRLTLARAYHLANLPASASVEIKRAAALAPDNDEIKIWLKRLK